MPQSTKQGAIRTVEVPAATGSVGKSEKIQGPQVSNVRLPLGGWWVGVEVAVLCSQPARLPLHAPQASTLAPSRPPRDVSPPPGLQGSISR